MAMKECRECKKEVSTEAKVCPSCGVKNPTKKKSRTLGILLGLGIFIAVIAMLGEKGKSTTAQETTQSAAATQSSSQPKAAPETAIEVTSRTIAKEYEQNEARADQQYKGKLLLVTGTVSGITKDFTDNTVVQLPGVNQFLQVQATLEKSQEQKAINLNKGQPVTLECRGAGEVATMPMLHDCIIK